jgi:hypothetical protein
MCYGSCAKAWPPYLTTGTPKAGAGVRKGLIGTTRRRGGSLQVTYGGHRLYYYEGDGKGQVRCQGVNNSAASGSWSRPAGRRCADVKQIGYGQLLRLLDSGAQLVEVLPEREFADEHLPGASSIPLKALDARRAGQLDRARAVVVYCWDSL